MPHGRSLSTRTVIARVCRDHHGLDRVVGEALDNFLEKSEKISRAKRVESIATIAGCKARFMRGDIWDDGKRCLVQRGR
jgi:hypothetical protein